MEFKEMKEKYFGKDINYIKEEIQKEDNFFKTDIDMIKLCIDAENCAREILELDKDFSGLYLFKKKYRIMLYILQNITNIELIPEDENFEDYDSFFEKAILETNSKALFFKEMVEDIIREKQNNILNELYDVFNTKLPSVEEIKEIKASIGDVFSNESPEQLKTIEKILAYNDPTMKTIKDVVMDVNINTELQNVLEKKIEEKENN